MPTYPIDVLSGPPGSLTVDVTDPNGNLVGPPNIVEQGVTFYVDYSWTVGGLIPFLDGTWRMHVLLSSQDPVGSVNQEFDAITPMVPGQTAYPPPVPLRVAVGPFALPPNRDSLTFRALAKLEARNAVNQRYPLGGVVDLGLIEVIQ